MVVIEYRNISYTSIKGLFLRGECPLKMALPLPQGSLTKCRCNHVVSVQNERKYSVFSVAKARR